MSANGRMSRGDGGIGVLEYLMSKEIIDGGWRNGFGGDCWEVVHVSVCL